MKQERTKTEDPKIQSAAVKWSDVLLPAGMSLIQNRRKSLKVCVCVCEGTDADNTHIMTSSR